MTTLHRFALRLLVAFALVGCGASSEELPCELDPRCIRYGISADIPILDPHSADAAEAGMIFRQIYDSLVYRDPATHGFVPGLATDWQVSPDGLHYTFELRQDVSFHDGSRFDASAVVRNVERIYDPEMPQSVARELLGPLTQYEILGEFSIRLTLASTYSAFLDALAQPFLGMASPKALDTYNSLRHQFHLAGTGPFQLAEYLPGERILLRRYIEYSVNPTFFSPLDGEEIDRIEFLITRDDDVDTLTNLEERLNIIDNVSPSVAQNLAGNSRVQILPTEIPGSSVQFLFNTAREHVSRREVRLALLLATNRVAIIDQVYFNFASVAWAPLSASTGYSHTGYVNRYGFDLEAAQELLAAAGYADNDGDGILDLDGKPLSLSIIVPPWGRIPELVSLLQQQWRTIGIDLHLNPLAGNTALASAIESGQYDLAPVESNGIDPQLLNRIFLESTVFGAYRAPVSGLNDLLLSAIQTMNPELRRTQVYEIQTLIMDEVLILPVRENVRLTAARADLLDLRFDAFGFYPLLYNVRIADN